MKHNKIFYYRIFVEHFCKTIKTDYNFKNFNINIEFELHLELDHQKSKIFDFLLNFIICRKIK